MNFPDWLPKDRCPRRQTERIVRIVTQEGFGFRGVLLGGRREGKTDLLRQIRALLFEKAEGPIPFFYSFAAARDEAAVARHLFAAFCQQVRAFLMRQEDFLSEPVASLERELERAGLPLSLMESARNFLGLPPAHQVEFVATLPAQFAHREARPLCLLLDDADALDPASPFFRNFDSPYLSWLLSGRYPALSRMAGARAWPLVRLEPFSRQEALELAERICRAAGPRFSRDAWEPWCEVVGTSPWLISSIVEAAALHDQPIESIEDLSRIYIQELSSGTIGQWLAERFENAAPDRQDRVMVSGFLRGVAKERIAAPAVPSFTPRVWDGLIAEEWAEETAAGPRILLNPVQRDWLLLATRTPEMSAGRSQSRILQDFLLRLRRQTVPRAPEPVLEALRRKLAALSWTGLPKVFESSWLDMYPPRISSVTVERDGNAELFWCYGSRPGANELSEVMAVLLIALCEESPSADQVDRWRRQLEKETRMLPRQEEQARAGRQELWLLVPQGTSLVPLRSERRFPWETFARLLESAKNTQTNTAPSRQP